MFIHIHQIHSIGGVFMLQLMSILHTQKLDFALLGHILQNPASTCSAFSLHSIQMQLNGEAIESS